MNIDPLHETPCRLSRPEPVVVLTHYDLDAAGASILLDYAYNVAGRSSCGYPKLQGAMETLRAEYTNINTLVVADLSMEPEVLQWALQHWDTVVYYDHHENSAKYGELEKLMPGHFIHNFDIDFSSTAIIFRELLENGNTHLMESFGPFVAMVNAYDMWYKDTPEFEQAEVLNDIFWDLHMDAFRARWVDGFGNGFTDLEKRQGVAKKKYRQEVVDRAMVEVLDSGSKIVMIDDTDAINSVSAMMEGDVFYVMYINPKTGAVCVSGRCKDSMPEINMNMAMEELTEMGDYDKIVKSGGGHANAIGIGFQDNVTANEIADFLATVLDKRVRNW